MSGASNAVVAHPSLLIDYARDEANGVCRHTTDGRDEYHFEQQQVQDLIRILSAERRYGTRISPLAGENTILISQTSRAHPRTGNNPYTLDHDEQGNLIERHVRLDDDAEMAQAVRDALMGELSS